MSFHLCISVVSLCACFPLFRSFCISFYFLCMLLSVSLSLCVFLCESIPVCLCLSFCVSLRHVFPCPSLCHSFHLPTLLLPFIPLMQNTSPLETLPITHSDRIVGDYPPSKGMADISESGFNIGRANPVWAINIRKPTCLHILAIFPNICFISNKNDFMYLCILLFRLFPQLVQNLGN